MPNRKDEPEFVVTDRRRFTDEGAPQTAERETERVVEEKSAPRPGPVAETLPEAAPVGHDDEHDHAHEHEHDHAHEHEHVHEAERPAPPSEKEVADGHRAYKLSTESLDAQLSKEIGADAVADEFKLSFDRVIEPFYVTAMMQLGLMGQEGPQRRVDIIGARQTIDTLNYLQEKTKGNLTKAEASLLESVLYQLRMQYLEITNALARAVQNPPAGAPGGIPKA